MGLAMRGVKAEPESLVWAATLAGRDAFTWADPVGALAAMRVAAVIEEAIADCTSKSVG